LVRGMFRMLWNSYSFFVLYANVDKFNPKAHNPQPTTLLDKWLLSELNSLIKDVNESMENYQLNRAARYFPKFIDNLSNWYIRRSRKRFWKSEDDADKKEAYQTLHYVLVELSKLVAPFTPFIAEEIYKNLTGEESVHLADFPVANEKMIDEKLNQEMEQARIIITEALQLRAKAGIKVRQPLNKFSIFNFQFSKELEEIIKEEINVKELGLDRKERDEMILDTEITEELKLEGQAREIIRFIQEMRKEAGYEVDNRINVWYIGLSEVFAKFGGIIKKEVLANELNEGNPEKSDIEKEFSIDGKSVKIYISRQIVSVK